ncbi:MAG: glutathione peroxidase [Bacteroidetes bacterium]|nr:MAG: glutathione peroxidase [Bacteroidota bacterium]REJ99751.1 MAG: glutathione peroxidase [Bacteroidota bacterium]REK34124.1 MAG: glutathione peroxidase [Bacteroidota bacterium]REK50455.1 MAG: glutathione peroxidase [Bacteroidota bacterium]
MKKIIRFLGIPFAALIGACTRPAEKPPGNVQNPNMTAFYTIKLNDINGKEVDFSTYKNKKLLIVNTASKCGYTPQYADLEKLQEKYKGRLIVLGFPSNQFGGQEPGSNQEIQEFCTENFNVTFTLFEKSDVKGSDKNELYRWLTDKSQNGWNEQEPTWNFCKYLIDEKGVLMGFYPASVNPFDEKIISQIE